MSYQEIRRDIIELGSRAQSVEIANEPLFHRASALHGSWGNAVRDAGLEYQIAVQLPRIRLRSARRAISMRLRDWVASHGPITPQSLRATDNELLQSVTQEFSTLENAAARLQLPIIRDTDDSGRLRCRMCGRYFKALATHLKVVHATTGESYKEEFGVHELMATELRQNMTSKVIMEETGVLAAIQDLAHKLWPLRRSWVRDNEPDLLFNALRFFKNWSQALEAAGLDASFAKRDSNEDVLEQVRRYAQKSPDNLGLMDVQAKDSAFVQKVSKRFGNWYAGLEAAGLDADRFRTRVRWTKQLVGRELRKWVNENGSLTNKALLKSAPRLHGAVLRFGGLASLAEELGLPFQSLRIRWSKEMVQERLAEWHEEHGPVSNAALHKTALPLFEATCRYFGDPAKAAEATGLPFEVLCEHGKWTPPRICKELQRIHATGLRMTHKRVADAHGWGVANAALRTFGSWERALQAADLIGANLDQEKQDALDPKRLCQAIDEWMEENGPLDATKMRKSAPTLHGRIMRKYGSFKIAAKALGLDYAAINRMWTKEKVCRELQRRAEEGDRMTADAIKATPGGAGLLVACRKHFGSYTAARNASGISAPTRGRGRRPTA